MRFNYLGLLILWNAHRARSFRITKRKERRKAVLMQLTSSRQQKEIMWIKEAGNNRVILIMENLHLSHYLHSCSSHLDCIRSKLGSNGLLNSCYIQMFNLNVVGCGESKYERDEGWEGVR